MSHRHASEPELLDRILEGRAPDAATAACPRCRAAAAGLEAFLEGCRSAARAEGPEAAATAGLVSRVLARTTGEDLAWRGDLMLLADFVRQRLAASRGLRLAAASLLAHLVALPLFAWLALRPAPPERSFRAHFETREQALPAVPQEPERELEPPQPAEPLPIESGSAGPETAAGRARRLERAHLLGTTAPEPAPPGAEPPAPVAELLALRADRLAGRRSPEAVRRATPALATELERALWVELLMDHLVLVGERLPGLETGFERIGAGPGAGAGSGAGTGGDPGAGEALARLELLVLGRAQALGILDAEGRGRAARLAAALGEPAPGGPDQTIGRRGFGRALAALLGESAGGWAGWDR